MNLLYSLPLHGVACEPFCRFDEHKQRYKLNVAEARLPERPQVKADWLHTDKGERYESRVELYAEAEIDYLKIDCQGKGGFEISRDGIAIDWSQGGTDSTHYFQTLAIALWLERKGVPCVHANALSLAGSNKAIALLAPSRTGKTTLTVALSGNGFEIMTDDMLALHQSSAGGNDKCTVEVYPGWPEVRLWPDSLKTSALNVETADKVHEQFSKVKLAVESHNSGKKRLETIYFLNRIEPGNNQCQSQNVKSSLCEIKPMPKAVALVQLLQNSMLGSAFQKIGLEEERFKALSEIVNSLEMKQVTYRSGYEHLGTVCQMIRQDAMG